MLLDKYRSLTDLKNLSKEELPQLCKEIRDLIRDDAHRNNGHLGSSFGVVELSVALHYVFNSPIDKIIWDTGHQSAPHKILTGRKDYFAKDYPKKITVFCDRNESEHDIFGAGHTSTSIAAAFGISSGREIIREIKGRNSKETKESGEIISIIGDAALGSGMAIESLCNTNNSGKRSIVIINDNQMSICPTVGNLSSHLKELQSKNKILQKKDIKTSIKSAFSKEDVDQNLFRNFGCGYIGIIDGHNIDFMIELFRSIKKDNFTGVLVLHISTEKGMGYNDAVNCEYKMHTISKREDNRQGVSMTNCFGEAIGYLMSKDKSIACISAAMILGTGLKKVKQKFPNRVFDVGICEQFAVTFAGGLSIEGVRPYCCIYSTFLQRTYGQIIHDIAIQSLPVRFVIDRAGYVGQVGKTHTGSFDISYLRVVPNIVIMSPSDEEDLVGMLKLMNNINDRPSAIRYSKSQYCNNLDIDRINKINPVELGKALVLKEGKDVCIFALGNMVKNAVEAYKILSENYNIRPTVVNVRFVNPFDIERLNTIASSYKYIITIEDGSIGGMGSLVNEELAKLNYKGKIVNICHPDRFIECGSVKEQQKSSGIDTDSIVNKILDEVAKK